MTLNMVVCSKLIQFGAHMFKSKKIMVLTLLLLPTFSYAFWTLTYRVTNLSTATVKFNSTDWLDWGTRIYQGETKHNSYWFPPKNMYLTIYNYDGSRFAIETASGCDLVGLPPLRWPTAPVYQIKGDTVRFESGTVDIVVVDAPGSSHNNKKIACSLVVSH